MRRQQFSCRSSGVIVAVGLAVGSSTVQAQFPVTSGPPIDMGSPVVASTPDVVASVPAATPSATDTRIRYALPLFSEARRKARVANRYTVARPVYAGRPGFTFAPYSDYYFPRTIGARETVYTAAPNAPVPVGFRAFARPGTTQVIPH